MRILGSSMLAKPGFGEWPPLRMENFTLKKPIVFMILQTSTVSVGRTMQEGLNQHV
jgi:hypothetical protein